MLDTYKAYSMLVDVAVKVKMEKDHEHILNLVDAIPTETLANEKLKLMVLDAKVYVNYWDLGVSDTAYAVNHLERLVKNFKSEVAMLGHYEDLKEYFLLHLI